MIIKMILTNGFDVDPRVYKEAKTLVKHGNDVEILCWDRENKYTNKEYEIIDCIKVKRFFPKSKYGSGYKQVFSYIKFIREVKNYLKDKKYDVVHGHDIDGFYASTHLNKKNCKYIWDMHEYYDGLSSSKFKNAVYEYIAKKCFKKVDGIIYVNENQKIRYKNKIKKTVLEEIINNVPEEENFNNFKRIGSSKLRISYIGNIRDLKALKMLMDTGEEYDNVKIQINGTGIAYEELNKISKSYKNTIMTGKFEYKNIKGFYENTDITYVTNAFSKDNEKYGCPNKGYESIYTGTPILANKGTYFGDFVEKNDIGFTIDGYGDLKRIIDLILSNKDILELKRKNINNIKNNFTWEKEESKLIKFYDSILSGEIV